jgi:hypothetical protein
MNNFRICTSESKRIFKKFKREVEFLTAMNTSILVFWVASLCSCFIARDTTKSLLRVHLKYGLTC